MFMNGAFAEHAFHDRVSWHLGCERIEPCIPVPVVRQASQEFAGTRFHRRVALTLRAHQRDTNVTVL